MKSTSPATHAFFKRAINVAEHYGFCNIDSLSIQPHPLETNLQSIESPVQDIDKHVIGNALSKLTESIELKKRNAVLFYTPSIVRHAKTPSITFSTITLNAIGSLDPLTEVVILKTTASVLEELGIKNFTLRINSLGDNDSATRFVREIGSRLRQQAKDIPSEYVGMLQGNMRELIARLYEDRHPLTKNLPRPLDFLTAPSRRHFKQVLELLEQTNIPFELDDSLYGNQNMYAHTIFEFIKQKETPECLHEIYARGGRYDTLTRAHARTAVPATGAVIAFETKSDNHAIPRPRPKKASTCLVHIGREARIKSISIIEAFRQAKIPIGQCLQFERFSEQIAYAESNGAKYIIILGQREVHDKIAVVRDMSDRSQRTIPLESLTDFVRTKL